MKNTDVTLNMSVLKPTVSKMGCEFYDKFSNINYYKLEGGALIIVHKDNSENIIAHGQWKEASLEVVTND